MDFPTWVRTLGAIVDEGNVRIQIRCATCGQHDWLDVPALIEKVGRDYSLINRRCKCRLFEGCLGWNVFGYVTNGWVYHLYDDATRRRWDESARKATENAKYEAALAPAVTLCTERGWDWVWKAERKASHWHVGLDIWAMEGRERRYKSRFSTTGNADTHNVAGLLASVVELSLDFIGKQDAINARFEPDG